mgnify:CR=1 FL=1
MTLPFDEMVLLDETKPHYVRFNEWGKCYPDLNHARIIKLGLNQRSVR